MAKHEQLEATEYVGEGDIFIVTKLDRLARSVALVEIGARLEAKGVGRSLRHEPRL